MRLKAYCSKKHMPASGNLTEQLLSFLFFQGSRGIGNDTLGLHCCELRCAGWGARVYDFVLGIPG